LSVTTTPYEKPKRLTNLEKGMGLQYYKLSGKVINELIKELTASRKESNADNARSNEGRIARVTIGLKNY